MGEPIDLLALDRDVRTGARRAAGQSTFEAVKALPADPIHGPHRDALLRWIHERTQARIGQDLADDEKEALDLEDPRLAGARTLTKAQQAIPKTYREAWAAMLAAEDPGRAAIAEDRLAELALPVAAVRKERRDRRAEIAKRLGLAGAGTNAWALAYGKLDELAPAARSLLDATEDVAREVLGGARKKQEAPWRASSAILLAEARDARDGWPARLGTRWLRDVFAAIVRREPNVALPAPLGGASFLRASYTFGAAFRTEGTARSLPFALARDPYPVSAHRFGVAFAAAMADPELHRRVLGLPERIARDQARSLRTSLLMGARTAAVRWLLASDDARGADFEELTTRLFGAPLSASLKNAWPPVAVDEPARFRAVLDGESFVRGLVDRYDADWFRNPKAGQHLVGLACGPIWDDDPPPADAPSRLAKRFEDALG